MRLGTGGRRDQIACAHRQGLVAPAILSFARDDEEQLVHHVMAMERKCLLPRWHNMHGAAKTAQSERRPDASPFYRELLAVAAIEKGDLSDVEDDLFRHPTLPSRLTEISFCASTANSMGSCCSTSLTNPLTTSATASSAESPRCMQ